MDRRAGARNQALPTLVLLFLNHEKRAQSAAGAEVGGPEQLLRAAGHNDRAGEKVSGVSFFGFLTNGQESEPRVLKAQLMLAATTRAQLACYRRRYGPPPPPFLLFRDFRQCQLRLYAVPAAGGDGCRWAPARWWRPRMKRYNDSEGDMDPWLQLFCGRPGLRQRRLGHDGLAVLGGRQCPEPHVPGRLRDGGYRQPGGGARQQHDIVRRQPAARSP